MNILPGKKYDLYKKFTEDLFQCYCLEDLQSLFVQDLSLLIPADSSILLFYEEDGLTVHSSITNNLDQNRFKDYLDYYQQYDQYKEIIHHIDNPPLVNRVSDYLDYTTWNKNEHRADFLLKQNVYHIACVEIMQQEQIHLSISLHRDSKHTDFSDQELQILYFLAPLINSAYQTLKPVAYLNNLLPEDELTVRERQILPMLLTRFSNEQLAEHFGVSINTIKTHIKNILRKLDCTSRVDLIFKVQKVNALS